MSAILFLLLASPFSGTWEGKMNGLPAVEITIGNSGRGTVIFYLQRRNEDDGRWSVAGQDKQPILAPKAKGKDLRFEVIHYKNHRSKERGPNARFRLELTGPDEATLYSDPPNEIGPIRLTRRAPPLN